ncbi:MAG: type II toxin-antitoxin system RelE/ParE family toxin, partial [Firmicutes bacterium]|nr:type II toxin-antitoxin system RelE/ParE family toxin [Bacillota bacterium]
GDFALNIEFDNEKLKKMFEDLNDVKKSQNIMKREIGAELTAAVKKRHNQLEAFSSFSALQLSGIGKLESLSGDRKDEYSMHLSANYRLIIKPKAEDTSAESLKICDTVIIKGVVDYHGKGNKFDWLIP